MAKIIFFNLILRFMMEGYLAFAIDSMLNSTHVRYFRFILSYKSYNGTI